jgi:toxin-antitoxin system PIN domain toxin
MPRSTSSFLFPDINVWLALSYERHIHYSSARGWFERLEDNSRVCFCRFTQLGLLRLLTSGAVMGEDKVLSQIEAWSVYDQWIHDDRVLYVEESSALEARFRVLTQDERPATKDWADSYLYAFAETADLHLVTFDQALRQKGTNVLLLQ